MRLSRPGPSVAFVLAALVLTTVPSAQAPPSLRQAVVGEAGQATPEISTADLERILADKSATVLDARPYREFAMSHIPGAVNVAAKAGVPMSVYVSDVAEIGRRRWAVPETWLPRQRRPPRGLSSETPATRRSSPARAWLPTVIVPSGANATDRTHPA